MGADIKIRDARETFITKNGRLLIVYVLKKEGMAK
jgi:hypothetical protein